MSDTIKLEIVTPEKTELSQDVNSITVPGTDGEFQVLHNHAPIISTLEIGKMKITGTDNNTSVYSCSGGIIEVLDNRALVLLDAVESVQDIDVNRAKAAADRAKDRLGQKKKDEVDVDRAELALKRAINRIKLSGGN